MSRVEDLMCFVAGKDFDKDRITSNELLDKLEEFDIDDLSSFQSLLMVFNVLEDVCKRDEGNGLNDVIERMFRRLDE